MIKDIVKDTEKLATPCRTAVNTDKEALLALISDLEDTATSYVESMGCVGLAANQIGSDLRVIVIKDTHSKFTLWQPMINPAIIWRGNGKSVSEEGCLSLEGTRTVKRWNAIQVIYKDINGETHSQKYTGFEATIVQHEIDHLNGKLI